MPEIPRDTIERVKAATDIVEVVSEHVQLRQQGRNWLGLCPFHNENTPSFNVNPELQIYHCFGCGVGGDIFKFLQEIDKVSFFEALTLLAGRAGISLPRSAGAAAGDERNDRLFGANELAAKYFQYMLRRPEGAAALRYLHRRGVTDETAEAFRLGYAPGGWTSFLDMATKPRRGFRAEELEQAGLALPGRSGRGHYDRFRDRVVFPITNLSGRTIGFGARALRDDDEPKYLNSPETPIYHKSGVLYGMAAARESIRRRRTALVVEGYMDVVGLAQHGTTHVVASSGTSLTPGHARLLGRYAERVVLLFDGDAAGGTAAERGVEVLLGTELDTRIATLPAGQDPDSFVRREGGAGALEELVESAPPALDVYLDRMAAAVDLTSVAGRVRAVDRLVPLFSQCREEVRRDLMLRRVAQRFEVDEQALRRDVAAAMSRPRRARPEEPEAQAPRPRTAGGAPKPATGSELERQFVGLLLQHPELIGRSREHLASELFADADVRRLVDYLTGHPPEDGHVDLTALLNQVDEDLRRLVSTCAMESFDPGHVEELWSDHMHRLRRADLTRRIEDATRQLRRASEAGAAGEVERLQADHRRLVVERTRLEGQGSAAPS
ncbi:MAG: DNA primase [Gemmatimonadaceae bacterium]|nr:DNA primase [Gemmatimonadaceae bacterium]